MSTKPVCVIGLGLIGGSVLRAAAAAGRTAWGYNRGAEPAAEAVTDGYDAGRDLVGALERATELDALVVVAVPMPAVPEVLDAVAAHAPNCALTDVVSVKGAVAEAVVARGLARRYVGGHPMAGASASGWSASTETLFDGAVWVVSVDNGVDPGVWREVAALALDCGSVVVPAVSTEHDRAVARVSHLPHMLAETLAAVGAEGGDLALRLAAGSFRDGTRVAGSSPTLVSAMCEANAPSLTEALDDAIALLTRARADLVEDGSTAEITRIGHAARRRYENQLGGWEIEGITIGGGSWLTDLRDAGRRGGVLRTLP